MSESKNTKKRQEDSDKDEHRIMLEARDAMWEWSKDAGKILRGEEISIFIAGYFTGLKKVSEAYEELANAE